jgi:hypothetical protein
LKSGLCLFLVVLKNPNNSTHNVIISKMSYGPDTEELMRCIESSTDELDINYLDIYSLPSLPNTLKVLICNNTHITELPTLSDYLEELNCYNTLITSLPNLPNELQELYCNNNQIISLPSLPNSLRILYCNYTKITKLPILPNNLEELYCDNNIITEIPLLPTNLHVLDCTNTKIIYLPPIPDNIIGLYCYNTCLLQRDEDEKMYDYIHRFRCWQEDESRKRIQERTRGLKEELVASVWHPRRVQRLLDLCGEDVDFEML